MAFKQKQLSLLREPKLWPLKTVENVLRMVDLGTEEPDSTVIAAIVRATLEIKVQSSWSGDSGTMRPASESKQAEVINEGLAVTQAEEAARVIKRA